MVLIVLKAHDQKGSPLEAVFAKDRGMNLISYKKGNVEIIDQSTRSLFEEYYGGLGALVGPHFHRRNPSVLSPVPDSARYPHVERMVKAGRTDPFSHGIARYAPWDAWATQTQFEAVISGKDRWNGHLLSELEGQDFKMIYRGRLLPSGLSLSLSVVSDTDSVVGTHFYYALPQGKGQVISRVVPHFLDQGHRRKIPSEWQFDTDHTLRWDLEQSADYTFHPYPSQLAGNILLDTYLYKVHIDYQCGCAENSWQLWHPEGASFVAIEPLSARDPHHPNLTVSSIDVQIKIDAEL